MSAARVDGTGVALVALAQYSGLQVTGYHDARERYKVE
jgi:hypothetical protein